MKEQANKKIRLKNKIQGFKLQIIPLSNFT